jgi:hypothetical protein
MAILRRTDGLDFTQRLQEDSAVHKGLWVVLKMISIKNLNSIVRKMKPCLAFYQFMTTVKKTEDLPSVAAKFK